MSGTTTPPTPESPTTPAAGEVVPEDKVYTFPHSALRALKDTEVARGRTEAERAQAAKLTEAGFKDLDEVLTLAKAAKPPVADPPPAKGEDKPADKGGTSKTPAQELLARTREAARLEERNKALEAAAEVAKAEAAAAKAAAEAAKAEADAEKAAAKTATQAEVAAAKAAAKAEAEFTQAAGKAGLADIEYGTVLYERHLKSLSEEDRAKADPSAFFKTLKTSNPALFTQVRVPIPGRNNEPAPTPADPGGGKGSRWLLTATPEEVRAHERALKAKANTPRAA